MGRPPEWCHWNDGGPWAASCSKDRHKGHDDPRFCWFSPVRMDMPQAGRRGHRSCGQPLQAEATGQVGAHCMVARGVNRHENRGSQQQNRPAMMGRQDVAGC